MEDTKVAIYNRLIGSLRLERDSYISHWRDLNEYILPRSARFFISQTGRGEKRNKKIVNNTATLSSRTLSSGMMAGVTSPARPWFKLSTGNPDLDDMDDVKDWLDQVGVRMREVFTRSNLYNALPIVYAELGVYGTAAMAALEDDETIIRFQNFPIGSYAIANDERGKVDTIIREWQMTARQLVQKFGIENCSDQVRRMYQANEGEQWIEVAHVVRRNPNFDPDKLHSKHKKFQSCYMERGAVGTTNPSDPEKFLRESGFDDFPVMVPRWSVTGEDIYGNSPAMDALGDIMALQLKEKRKAMMIDKGANPPMAAPSALKNQRASLLPGDVTYVDVNQGSQGFKPVYEPNPTWLSALTADIQNDEQRIKRAFFEDLFLMLTNMERAQITATEIAERKEEKLLVLGPVIDRLNDELLDPLIDRTFAIMVQRSRPDWDAGLPGLIPVPPDSMRDVELKVEYTSVMAQALRMVGLGSIERFAGFMGNMAAADPSVLDKWNRDATIDEYGGMIGLTPKIINSEEEVAAIRAQRAKQQQAAESMQLAEQGAKAAQTMASADLSGDNALARVIQNMQGATA
ncbi:portal protein [Herminiimonas contaminans]|uniref:Phage tail protein n=1 Tax=Herminiimonas contaminans TaxID=1111140 RepID=A0ABS0ESW6_9BURK|nr:portal protein [Herminiimonas contaminans]MBF8177815.1 phage tail protein [Herminiimonas contaminans]